MTTTKKFSPDQQVAADGIRTWLAGDARGKVASLAGYAGCGKTFVISTLAREWENEGRRVLFVSPTGKASLVLAQQMRDAGVTPDVMTIHKAIYEAPKENHDGSLEWSRHGREISAPLVVIDEASMVGVEIWRDLQVACDGAAFLAVGDHGQLHPVDASAGLLEDPTWRLEKIHRQAADNPVIEFSRLVREVGVREALAFAKASTDERLSFRRIMTAQDSLDVVRWTYASPDAQQGMVIVSTNAERCTVNKIARRAFGFVGDPQPNDLVMVLRNHHNSGLVNGHRAVLRSVIPCGQGMIRTDMHHSPSPLDQFGAERTMGNAQAPRSCLLLDYGYAVTAHKAQGSQASRVAVSLSGTGWLERKGELARWLYTAATRAEHQLMILT